MGKLIQSDEDQNDHNGPKDQTHQKLSIIFGALFETLVSLDFSVLSIFVVHYLFKEQLQLTSAAALNAQQFCNSSTTCLK